MNKIIKISLASILIVVIAGFLFDLFSINITSTLETKYLESNNPNKHIIQTSFFRMETPKDWINISSGFGSHGEQIGYIITPKGSIFYEYGILVNSYNPKFSSYDSSDYYLKKVGRFELDIIQDRQEIGISIAPQNEMGFVFSLHKSSAVKDNFQEIIEGLVTIEFAPSKPVFKEKK